jgi:hypothetical protein
MSPKLRQKFIETFSDALNEINEFMGYEYFKKSNIRSTCRAFLELEPFAEWLLMMTRGVSLQDLERENIDREKAKKAVIKGIFDGLIIRNYHGTSFDNRFGDYLYRSGTEHCPWIRDTHYDDYYKTLSNLTSRFVSRPDTLLFIGDFTRRKIKSHTQTVAKMSTRRNFFTERHTINASLADEHIEVFRDIGAIAENYMKLLFGIKHDYGMELTDKLEKTEFHLIWKDLKDDKDFKIFTLPFPNTVYWNASKHAGITKRVKQKELEIKSNEGNMSISYSYFVALVRELYACCIVMGKVNLMIMYHSRFLA